MSEAEKFDQWAVVELFGHQQIAGRVTEASIGGCSFLRVDVPEQAAQSRSSPYTSDRPAIPAYTRYFGNGAIYALNPCTEEVAQATARSIRSRPPLPFDVGDLMAVRTPALNAPNEDPFMDHEND